MPVALGDRLARQRAGELDAPGRSGCAARRRRAFACSPSPAITSRRSGRRRASLRHRLEQHRDRLARAQPSRRRARSTRSRSIATSSLGGAAGASTPLGMTARTAQPIVARELERGGAAGRDHGVGEPRGERPRPSEDRCAQPGEHPLRERRPRDRHARRSRTGRTAHRSSRYETCSVATIAGATERAAEHARRADGEHEQRAVGLVHVHDRRRIARELAAERPRRRGRERAASFPARRCTAGSSICPSARVRTRDVVAPPLRLALAARRPARRRPRCRAAGRCC